MEGWGVLVEEMFEFDLEVAVGGEEGLAEFGEGGSAAALAAGGGGDEGFFPGVIHGIDEEPGPAVAVVELAGGFGKGAADGDLFEEVRAGFGEGGALAQFEGEAAAEADGGGRGGCWRGRGRAALRGTGAGGFAAGVTHRRWRS